RILRAGEVQAGSRQVRSAPAAAGCATLRGMHNSGRRQDGAISSDLNDDVGELLGVGEAAERVERQLERLARADGRLSNLAGGRFDVLGANGVGHVESGYAARRQLLRVEPGADAVVALAQVVDIRDA